MNRKISFLCFLSIGLIFCDLKGKKFEPPNVIIIFTDDQGYNDVGCYGSPDINTPHLDKMASEGLRLTSFYAAQAVCSASRAALLTGCYPNRIGIHGAFMPNAKKGLNHDEVTIAEMLKDIGYSTAIYGKWHLGDHEEFLPLNHGFDEFYGIPYSNDMWPFHPQQGPIFNFGPLPLIEGSEVIDTLDDQSTLTVEITERSVAFIKRKKDEPFFLYVAHPQPHVPLFVSDRFKGKSERGLYGDVIMEIDWSTGEILNALREEGIDENTIVIFTSDNGPWLSYGDHSGSAYPLREGKGTAWEGGQREPCIIRYPSLLPKGIVLDQPIMAIDILPTIAEITGASLPDHTIDGKSAWPLLTGSTDSSPQEAYYFYYHTNELHGIRYRDWKLYFPHRYRTLSGRDGGKDGLPVEYDYINLELVELYNLTDDIGEFTDVAADFPEVVDTILGYAEIARVEMGDKLMDRKGNGERVVGKILE
ncbi:MAG: sulfatase [Saprospiraceae bacterium]|nr:sulfatase [Saprospiraceae bacterium]